jgi:hypothetical protein
MAEFPERRVGRAAGVTLRAVIGRGAALKILILSLVYKAVKAGDRFR